MRILILGVCGTLMTGCSILAKEQGHEVYGWDKCYLPPMSDLLSKYKIHILSSSELLDYAFDLVLLGNSISKKDDVYQILSNAKVQFISAPEWLSEYVLTNRKSTGCIRNAW